MVDFLAEPISAFDLAPLGVDDAMPPTLVVHDRLDKETSFDVGERLAAAWSSAQLLATEGLGHQRILADADVVGRVVEHVTAR